MNNKYKEHIVKCIKLHYVINIFKLIIYFILLFFIGWLHYPLTNSNIFIIDSMGICIITTGMLFILIGNAINSYLELRKIHNMIILYTSNNIDIINSLITIYNLTLNRGGFKCYQKILEIN